MEILDPDVQAIVRAAVLTPACARPAEPLTALASFVTEYSLARLWLSWGVRPDTLIGVGVGEFAARLVKARG